MSEIHPPRNLTSRVAAMDYCDPPPPPTRNVGYTATGRRKLRRCPSATHGQHCLLGGGARAPCEHEVKFRG
eukprot:10651412-Lingulodinium_polyedra.AAC.1